MAALFAAGNPRRGASAAAADALPPRAGSSSAEVVGEREGARLHQPGGGRPAAPAGGEGARATKVASYSCAKRWTLQRRICCLIRHGASCFRAGLLRTLGGSSRPRPAPRAALRPRWRNTGIGAAPGNVWAAQSDAGAAGRKTCVQKRRNGLLFGDENGLLLVLKDDNGLTKIAWRRRWR